MPVHQFESPTEQPLFAAFEPFSAIILQMVAAAKDYKAKNAVFESVINDTRAEIINADGNINTTIFPNHRGIKSKYWEQTKQMAFDLNKVGIDVAFLPEYDSATSADALLRIGKIFRLADFKYASTTNSNTLAEELIHGFKQANTVVLKLERMDRGVFEDTVDYIRRNEERDSYHFGTIILQNKRGETLIIGRADIRRNKYQKKNKGIPLKEPLYFANRLKNPLRRWWALPVANIQKMEYCQYFYFCGKSR